MVYDVFVCYPLITLAFWLVTALLTHIILQLRRYTRAADFQYLGTNDRKVLEKCLPLQEMFQVKTRGGLLLVSSGKGHTAGGDLPPQFCKAANTTACPCRTLPLAVQPMLTSEVAVF